MKYLLIILLFISNYSYAATEATLQDAHGNAIGISANPLVVHCTSGCGGGTGSPGGSNTQVQYNNNTAFGGITGATTDGTKLTLVAPILGAATATSINKVSITAPTTTATLSFGTDNSTLTFQGNGTIVNRDSTDTLTNKTFDTAGTGNTFKINGTTISSVSGNTSKVMTSSGTLTSGNCAKFDASGNLVDNGSSCGAGGGSGTVTSSTSGFPAYYPSSSNTVTGFIYQFYSNVNNSSSGVDNPVSIPFTTNESGTAGFTALKINVTETTTGSGFKFLQDWQVGGSSKANLDDTGSITALSLLTNGTSAGLLKLKEPSGVGSTYVGLQAPSSIASSVTWTLPSSDSSGCFQSNGLGVISLAACGSSQWITNGSDIYYLNGLVGIGKIASSYSLDIQAATGFDLRIIDTLNSSTGGLVKLGNDPGAALANGNRIGVFGFVGSQDASHTISSSNSAAVSSFATETWTASNHGSELHFETTPNSGGSRTTQLTIGNSGSMTLANASTHAGQATCWTTSGVIGYCTTVVSSGGACTCTGL